MEIPKLPAKINTYLLIGIGGIIVFFVFVIYPYHKSLANADLDIKTIKSRIEEQKILYPVFLDLLKKARVKETKGLPFPEKARLSRDDAAKISAIFKDIAQENNFKLTEIIPDAESLVEGSEHFKVNLVMQGDFTGFRNFLVSLGEVPYLEHIERFQIRTVRNYKEIRLKVWLAQE
jgi:hypothetical protein